MDVLHLMICVASEQELYPKAHTAYSITRQQNITLQGMPPS